MAAGVISFATRTQTAAAGSPARAFGQNHDKSSLGLSMDGQMELSDTSDLMDVDSGQQSPRIGKVGAPSQSVLILLGEHSENTNSVPTRSSGRIKQKWSLAQTLSLSNRLLKQDAIYFFVDTCEAVLADWISLIQKTTLPMDTPLTPDYMSSAFDVLEGIITNRKEAKLSSRFGYVQLVNFFQCLEDRIKLERRRGRFERKSGYGNASLAIDIYLHARKGVISDSRLKSQLRERKRIGRRWKRLAGPSELFLIIYSDLADVIVYAVAPLLLFCLS